MENAKMRVLRLKDLAEILGVSLTTLWRLRRESDFPSPVLLGARSIGYTQVEIEEWLNSRKIS